MASESANTEDSVSSRSSSTSSRQSPVPSTSGNPRHVDGVHPGQRSHTSSRSGSDSSGRSPLASISDDHEPPNNQRDRGGTPKSSAVWSKAVPPPAPHSITPPTSPQGEQNRLGYIDMSKTTPNHITSGYIDMTGLDKKPAQSSGKVSESKYINTAPEYKNLLAQKPNKTPESSVKSGSSSSKTKPNQTHSGYIDMTGLDKKPAKSSGKVSESKYINTAPKYKNLLAQKPNNTPESSVKSGSSSSKTKPNQTYSGYIDMTGSDKKPAKSSGKVSGSENMNTAPAYKNLLAPKPNKTPEASVKSGSSSGGSLGYYSGNSVKSTTPGE